MAPEMALAHTVGEALALKLWSYAGVGDDELPADFHAWWQEYSRARHLPPSGCRQGQDSGGVTDNAAD